MMERKSGGERNEGMRIKASLLTNTSKASSCFPTHNASRTMLPVMPGPMKRTGNAFGYVSMSPVGRNHALVCGCIPAVY